MWVYMKQRQEGAWMYTVGYWYNHYYSGEGRAEPRFHPVEDFSVEGAARQLVHYLNGGAD